MSITEGAHDQLSADHARQRFSITQGAYAHLRVEDLQGTVEFHTDVLGLRELGREDGAVSLGCGLDDRVDLILSEGGTGTTLVGLEVDSEDALDYYAVRLTDHGVASERRTDSQAGVGQALHFTAPNGLAFELGIAPDKPSYLNPGMAQWREGIAPLDFDHLTLKVPDPEAMIAFLTGPLEFTVSDEMRPQPDMLLAAWTRTGSLHHDIAMFRGPAEQTLHHYALRLESFEHLKHAADRLASAGVKIEAGPGRHSVGGNCYLFFWGPGGNRYEFSAEMPVVGNRQATIWTDLPTAFSAWGAAVPATFAEGS